VKCSTLYLFSQKLIRIICFEESSV